MLLGAAQKRRRQRDGVVNLNAAVGQVERQQIASFGGPHLRVSKQVVDGRTSTLVEKIDDEQKIEEISRMLGGVDVPETARDHAREMRAAAAAASAAVHTGRSKHAKKSAHR